MVDGEKPVWARRRHLTSDRMFQTAPLTFLRGEKPPYVSTVPVRVSSAVRQVRFREYISALPTIRKIEEH